MLQTEDMGLQAELKDGKLVNPNYIPIKYIMLSD